MTRFALPALLLFAASALAQSDAPWPQWRGPDRTGVSKETGLLKEWPAGGPRLLWKAEGLGRGWASVAVAGGRAFTLSDKKPDEFLVAVDVASGKVAWSTKIGLTTDAAGGYPGARSTPTWNDGRVYGLTSNGDLAAVNAADGKLIWAKNLRDDLGGRPGAWAYSESVLIDGDRLICTPGGKGSTMVALDKNTGAVVWRSHLGDPDVGDNSQYASIIIARTGEVKTYVQFLHTAVVGVAAADGKQLWNYERPAQEMANASTPIFHDGFVFASSGYGTGGERGGGLVKVGPAGAKEIWFQPRLANQHGGVVLVDGRLYGTDNNSLLCVDFATGKVLWQDRSVGKGSLIAADGKLYVRGESGTTALVDADGSGYRERGRFEQPHRSKTRAWAIPVVADGKLYLRDMDVLLCYEVKK